MRLATLAVSWLWKRNSWHFTVSITISLGAAMLREQEKTWHDWFSPASEVTTRAQLASFLPFGLGTIAGMMLVTLVIVVFTYLFAVESFTHFLYPNPEEVALYFKAAALPGVPVGYVDAYYLFEKHPRVTAACDVVMTNCYPFWEGCPREQALAYMQSMMQRTRAAAPGKRVLISETGWPDQGSPFHGAVPSEEGAMRYFIDTMRWARDEGIEVFYFAAFDEAWKVGAEGDVGAYWGLWDKDARLKFG